MREMNASAAETAPEELLPTARGVSPAQRHGDVLWGELGWKKELEGGSWEC